MTKRKRNNELQRTKRLAAAQLKNCAMVYVSTAEQKYLYSEKYQQFVVVTAAINQALEAIRWNWSVLLVVFCRERNGKLKAVPVEASGGAEYYYKELGRLLSEIHADLARECREHMEVIGVGWYAVPRIEEVNIEKAMPAFEKLDCWDKSKHKDLIF